MQSAFILASGAGGLGFALLLWRLLLRCAYEAARTDRGRLAIVWAGFAAFPIGVVICAYLLELMG
jgi:hypothetical protein